jgi:threonine dehydrogenase-like Zn-dependent dehydrogenase
MPEAIAQPAASTERRTIRSLGIERPGQTFFFSYDEGPLPEGQFRVETLYSGLSAGTELSFYKGTNPYLQARWDEQLCVFQTGEAGVQFPLRFLGYMEVGRVVASRPPAVEVGQVLAMSYGHKTGHTADPTQEFFVVLPPELDPLLGIYVAQMGPICANGLLHAAADLVNPAGVRTLGDGVHGQQVLVLGAGVVGLLTGLFARQLGAAEVAIADETPARLAAARAIGLTAVDSRNHEVWRWCKERWHHTTNDRGADLVFQCRAQPASLQTALRSLRPQGTVIDLAFYQGGAPELLLGQEFHHNGLAIRWAQIGRVPRGLGHLWSRRRLAHETVELLRQQGPLLRQHVITDVVPLETAPGLIDELATRRRHVIQAVFTVAA